jgi:hypothetical protein
MHYLFVLLIAIVLYFVFYWGPRIYRLNKRLDK